MLHLRSAPTSFFETFNKEKTKIAFVIGNATVRGQVMDALKQTGAKRHLGSAPQEALAEGIAASF